MKKSVRWLFIGVFAAVVLAVLAVGLFGPTPRMKLGQSPIYKDIKLIRKALFLYESEHNQFPFDDRGPAYALYKLKPYFPELPSMMPANTWNHNERKLNVVSINYINEAPLSKETKGRSQVEDLLLWVPVENGKKLCLTKWGTIFYEGIGDASKYSTNDASETQDHQMAGHRFWSCPNR